MDPQQQADGHGRDSPQKQDSGPPPSGNPSNLITAITINNLEFLKEVIVKQGANVEAKLGRGERAIHVAAREGNCEAVKLLLANDANINAETNDGSTALHIACAQQHAQVCQLLITEQASLAAKGPFGRTAFHVACGRGLPLDTIETFINNGASVNETNDHGLTALHMAVVSRHLSIVDLLLKNKADVNAKDDFGLSPLHYAAGGSCANFVRTAVTKKGLVVDTTAREVSQRQGLDDIIRKLLGSSGVDIDCKDRDGRTPLHYAVWDMNTVLIGLLLDAGASFCADKDGYTPLHMAVHRQNHKALHILLRSSRVDVNASTKHGATALHLAAFHCSLTIVMELLHKGAEISPRDKDGLTPHMIALVKEQAAMAKVFKYTTKLLRAVVSNSRKSIKRYIRLGAMVNARALDGSTAIHHAVQHGLIDHVKTLIRAGADLNIKTTPGNYTVVHMAVNQNRQLILKVLLHYASNYLNWTKFVRLLDAQSAMNSRTALHMAAKKDNVAAIRMLLQSGAAYDIRDKDNFRPINFAFRQVKHILRIVDKMFEAAEAGKDSCVSICLEVERSIVNSRKHKDGWTVLHYAAYHNHLNVIKVVLQHNNVRLDIYDNDGNSPLHLACLKNNVEIVEYLLEHVDFTNLFDRVTNLVGQTALHVTDNMEIALLLMSHGARFDCKDAHGRTPAQLTSSQNTKALMGLTKSLFELVLVNDSKIVSKLDVITSDKVLIAILSTKNEKYQTLLQLARSKRSEMKELKQFLQNRCDEHMRRHVDGLDRFLDSEEVFTC